VVNLPLFGVAEDVVGLGKSLELFFCPFVARIDVGMILARQLAKRLANVVGRGRLLYAENAVIVFIFGWGGHGLAIVLHSVILSGTLLPAKPMTKWSRKTPCLSISSVATQGVLTALQSTVPQTPFPLPTSQPSLPSADSLTRSEQSSSPAAIP